MDRHYLGGTGSSRSLPGSLPVQRRRSLWRPGRRSLRKTVPSGPSQTWPRQLLGAVNVSLYTSLPGSQVSYILQDSGSRVFVVSTGIQLKKAEAAFDQCPALERVVAMSELPKEHSAWATKWDDALDAGSAILPEVLDQIEATGAAVRPDDTAALIYTSGTTGTPKGAMITHDNFCSNASASLACVPFGDGDHHLSFLPLCHVFERTAGYTAVLAAGARISYAESVNTVNRDLAELGAHNFSFRCLDYSNASTT